MTALSASNSASGSAGEGGEEDEGKCPLISAERYSEKARVSPTCRSQNSDWLSCAPSDLAEETGSPATCAGRCCS